MTDFILHTEIAFPEHLPFPLNVFRIPLARLMRAATVSTYPKYIRKMFGINQPAVVDWFSRLFMRIGFTVVSRNPWLYLYLGELFIPTTMPVAAHAVLQTPANSPVTMTPREAQAKYG